MSSYLPFYSYYLSGILEDAPLLFPASNLFSRRLNTSFAPGYGIKLTLLSPLCFVCFLYFLCSLIQPFLKTFTHGPVVRRNVLAFKTEALMAYGNHAIYRWLTHFSLYFPEY